MLSRLSLILLLNLCFAAVGVAELRVYPTRVVIEGNTRAASLQLRHEGQEAATYKISLRKYHFAENGKATLVELTAAEQRNLSRLIRFSPRLVKLKPQEEQTVRLLARTTSLPDGETNLHIHLTTFEDKDAKLLNKPSDDSKIKTQLKAHFAVAIPIIIRKGQLQAEYSLAQGAFFAQDQDNKIPRVMVTLKKTGNRSVSGTFEVFEGESKEAIGVLKGVSLYDEIRNVSIPLNLNKKLSANSLRIEFTEAQDQRRISTKVSL